MKSVWTESTISTSGFQPVGRGQNLVEIRLAEKKQLVPAHMQPFCAELELTGASSPET